MKPVICIQRSGIKPVAKLDDTDLVVMDRRYVDGPDVAKYKYFPQIIPLIIIKDKEGSYLVYKRQGTETRLDNKLSLTLGGHIDLDDLTCSHQAYLNQTIPADWSLLTMTVCLGANRELKEEAGIFHKFQPKDFHDSIYITDDEVSMVHVGYPTFLTIDRIDFMPTEEVSNYEWIPLDTIKDDYSMFELWSQKIIDTI